MDEPVYDEIPDMGVSQYSEVILILMYFDLKILIQLNLNHTIISEARFLRITHLLKTQIKVKFRTVLFLKLG